MWIGHMIHSRMKALEALLCISAWVGKLCLRIPTLTVKFTGSNLQTCDSNSYAYYHRSAYDAGYR